MPTSLFYSFLLHFLLFFFLYVQTSIPVLTDSYCIVCSCLPSTQVTLPTRRKAVSPKQTPSRRSRTIDNNQSLPTPPNQPHRPSFTALRISLLYCWLWVRCFCHLWFFYSPFFPSRPARRSRWQTHSIGLPALTPPFSGSTSERAFETGAPAEIRSPCEICFFSPSQNCCRLRLFFFRLRPWPPRVVFVHTHSSHNARS
jgi:hypothetical protein